MSDPKLDEFPFQHHYDHVRGDEMLETFYVPMLERSLTYDRVAGYFSSAVLSHASAGFAKFCSTPNLREADGLPKFRLIVGARLNPKDEQVVLHAENPELLEEIESNLLNSIDNIDLDEDFESFEQNRFQGLSWMLKTGILEIKVGAMCDPEKQELLPHNEAEFHSKFGIVNDGESKLYFSGSANETKRAWLDNYETIDVSRSWVGLDSQEKIQTYEEKFESLWNNERVQQGVVVVDFPRAAKLKILDKFRPADPSRIDEVSEAKRRRRRYIVEEIHGKSEDWNKSYHNINIWRHQSQAVDWFLDSNKANGVGIFQMATGSGKTRTAIKAAIEAVSKGLVKKTIICVPKTLEEQWAGELAEHYNERRGTFWWKSGLDEHLNFFNLNVNNSVMIVSNHYIPSLLEFAYNKPTKVTDTLIIVDEMHHIGETRYKGIGKIIQDDDSDNDDIDLSSFAEGLFAPFKLRLGLSATPWSEYDDSRNQLLVDNFVNNKRDITELGLNWRQRLIDQGDVFYFGLEDGIRRGILCEFDYIPLEYIPSIEDFEERKLAFRKIPPDLPAQLQEKMGRILAAKVFKKSREKLPPFSRWLQEHGELERCILFVEDQSFGRDVTKILAEQHQIYQFKEFFQGEDMETLRKFAAGKLDLLIACRRISEGVDIQTVDTVVLFSSNASKLETIQRIGRALRTNFEKPNKRAEIVDFIYDDGENGIDNRRKKWLEELSEVRRN